MSWFTDLRDSAEARIGIGSETPAPAPVAAPATVFGGNSIMILAVVGAIVLFVLKKKG